MCDSPPTLMLPGMAGGAPADAVTPAAGPAALTPGMQPDAETPARTKRSHKGKVRFLLQSCSEAGQLQIDAVSALLPVCPYLRHVAVELQAPQRYEDTGAGSVPRTDKRPRTAKKFVDD